jgi:hypothetical protein
MMNSTVVIVGELPIDHLALDLLVAEFGWSLKKVADLGCLETFDSDYDPVTILFGPKLLDLPWDKALRSVIAAFPRTLPILCRGFGEHLDLSQVVEAGAFHSLLVPFSVSEVRQSLGFVWCARRLWTPIHPQPVLRRREGISERSPMRTCAVA